MNAIKRTMSSGTVAVSASLVKPAAWVEWIATPGQSLRVRRMDCSESARITLFPWNYRHERHIDLVLFAPRQHRSACPPDRARGRVDRRHAGAPAHGAAAAHVRRAARAAGTGRGPAVRDP